jgi:predicted ATPase
MARRGHFLRADGAVDWPDGTLAARYGFLHSLYQQALHERVPSTRRSNLHQRIGERLEQGYDDLSGTIATELAIHFQEGRDYRRAVRYLVEAGENAVQRGAPEEAIQQFSRALELLERLPDIPERTEQQLALHGDLQEALTCQQSMSHRPRTS